MPMTEKMADVILRNPKKFGPQKVGAAKAFLRDLKKKKAGQTKKKRIPRHLR